MTTRQTPVSNAVLLSPTPPNTTRYATSGGWLSFAPRVCVKFYLRLLPTNPGTPELSTLGQSPVETLSSPIISQTRSRVKPRCALLRSLRLLPGAGHGPHALGYRLADPTGKTHILQDHPGTGQLRPDGYPWASSKPARGIPGSVPAPRQAIGTYQYGLPDLTETPSPPPPGSRGGSVEGLARQALHSIVLPASRLSPRGSRSSRECIPELFPALGHCCHRVLLSL